jgi:hypothetical protein
VRLLSKSKLIAFRQCPRRLWLEVHRPQLRADSPRAQAAFRVGNEVGRVARQLYDPEGTGELVDLDVLGFNPALDRTRALLGAARPIFEAGFAARGAVAFADVLLPAPLTEASSWHLIEVKSSASLKDTHRDDAAIQAWIARGAQLDLASVRVAHIDTRFVYPGGGDYRGLLREHDLTAEVAARANEVATWVEDAHRVADLPAAPERATGPHCHSPHECGFLGHCRSLEPQAEHPVAWLPRVTRRALREFLAGSGARDLREVPDELLTEEQCRVKHCTLTGSVHFDRAATTQALATQPSPARFLDFETTQFAVPVWPGTRPHQQIPFQFSLQVLAQDGSLAESAFLDLSGADPRGAFAEALIASCGSGGAIFVYNAAFEAGRIRELAALLPQHAAALQALALRLVDLLPIVQAHFYHPAQQGSWSIKKVLAAVFPELAHDTLDGVKDGAAAAGAYQEAIAPTTSPERRAQIEAELRAYCRRDTEALARLWSFLRGA